MTSSQGLPQSPALPHSFIEKKHRILEALAVPVSEYDDLSPKGSIDVGIRDLIDEINSLEGCVTTSSCAGRVSVFLEGSKTASEGEEEEGEGARTVAGVGGKGGGGEWLFVSHDPIPTREDGRPLDSVSWCKAFAMEKPSDLKTELAGNRRDISKKRFVHFKFEPMILHILTASPQHAQLVLSAALQAGFRESGALNITSSSTEAATPMVGIRSMGLSLESLVGVYYNTMAFCTATELQLDDLVAIANTRFLENTKRIERFRNLLKEFMNADGISGTKKKQGDIGEWEDKDARRERKRAEGLKKALAAKEVGDQEKPSEEAEDIPDIGRLGIDT